MDMVSFLAPRTVSTTELQEFNPDTKRSERADPGKFLPYHKW
jgi:hypothetical protein